MPKHPLRVIPLGGLGEIGKNMMALEYHKDIIVIDAGVMFPEADMPGVDLVIPDISYLVENKERVRAIFITHGHEDHTGALPFILRELHVPVYAPRLALGLISVKLGEHKGLKGSKLIETTPGKEVHVGDFRVNFFPVCHSIPDAMGLAIKTPLGLVIHTGDFKIDHTPVNGMPTDLTALAQLSEAGVFLLLSDSTYAELPGYTPSEMVVGEVLERVIGASEGRVMVATFASLISRVQQVIDAAHKHEKKVALIGRSMVNNAKMALEMGYLTDPGGVITPLRELRKVSNDRVVLVMTGSQGEPTSALVRISNRDHRDVEITPGDTVVVSATPIPGNEKAVSRAIDNLYRQGAHVLHDKIALVHVHGHASQEELKIVLNLTRPKFFVPVHGQFRHLVNHADLAYSVGIPQENSFVLEDGDVLELTSTEGVVVGQVPAGHVYIDGLSTWDMKSVVLRDRRALSRDGIVVVVLTINKTTGKIVKNPEVVSSGFVEGSESLDLIKSKSESIIASLGHRDETSQPPVSGYMTTKVKESLGNFLYEQTGRRPMIVPVVVEV
ncbi:MAG: ribonuclease J [SAR202 cluster bacterium Io17-Chloro-G3]|nr:MAG: ribonuclease J [SAR202 cluster bacterium Io17-Chloro-G3]